MRMSRSYKEIGLFSKVDAEDESSTSDKTSSYGSSEDDFESLVNRMSINSTKGGQIKISNAKSSD